MLYTTDYKIDPIANTITGSAGEHLKLRPRTFKLLLSFLARAGNNLSKEEILHEVWSDVVVGEHVVFQSVKEIRQAFAPHDVIKTVPKQGYTWIKPVSSQQVDEVNTSVDRPKTHHKKRVFTLLASIGAVLFVALTWLTVQPAHGVSGAVVVLPVSNRIDDNNLSWVRLGAMDQLIQQLMSGEQSGVLHTDYVFEVLSRAQITTQFYSAADIRKVFKVSGAGLVVESQLAGSPQDYQLHYTLHRPDSSSKGVVFASSITTAFNQLAERVAQKSQLSMNPLPADYQSEFANELIANALLARYENNSEVMIQLLQAAVASEPDNLTAKRLLLEAWLKKGDSDNVATLLEQTFLQYALAPAPSREHIRITYFAAINALRKQDVQLAEAYLDQTENMAAQLNEWLYMAYIYEARGRIAQQRQRYDEASDAFAQARRYHRVLNCPFGESSSLLYLSALAKDQHHTQEARRLLGEAIVIIEQRDLVALAGRVNALQQSLN